jgi:uncharacterized protein
MSKPKSPKPEQATLHVRVVPRSSQSRLGREADGSLKVWVNAPPVDGAANEAVCAVVAEALGVAKGSITIVSGHSHRNKVVGITGLGQGDVNERLRSKGP